MRSWVKESSRPVSNEHAVVASFALSEHVLVSVLFTALVGCAAALPPASDAAPPVPPPAASAAAPPPAPAASTAPSPSGRPCGELDCLAFTTPRAAFEQALVGSPRVVAIGEAHAQKAMGSVESATRRFARDLLPALAPHVKGLVIELLAPAGRCGEHEEAAVAERAKPVTEPQKDTNQSEFLALGFEAKKIGIRAEPLIPTCAELKSVLGSENDVGALLELIANVTLREAADFLDHQPASAAIAIYGGLVHNDATPSPGHESWSFGPRLSEHASGSYVEVDLIVPELVRSEPPWTALPWFSHYDPARSASETLLYRTGPRSFVLIFPRTEATEPAKAAP
jgi:hypothetical protein